ncbi:MAG: DNA polymerase III subunit chi [Rhodoferax sp.]
MSAAVTDVAFHFGAPDKVAYAVRLLRKAVGTGVRVLVVADAGQLTRLDAALWASGATDFNAHCFNDATAQAVARSPVVLSGYDGAASCPPLDVLVNLGTSMPQAFDRHPRVIEVVSTEEEDRMLARQRWKTYAAQGIAPDSKNLNLRA